MHSAKRKREDVDDDDSKEDQKVAIKRRQAPLPVYQDGGFMASESLLDLVMAHEQNRLPRLFLVHPTVTYVRLKRVGRVCSTHIPSFLREQNDAGLYSFHPFPHNHVLRLGLTCPWCDDNEATATDEIKKEAAKPGEHRRRTLFSADNVARIRERARVSKVAPIPFQGNNSPVDTICSAVSLREATDQLMDQLSDRALLDLVNKYKPRIKAALGGKRK